MVTIPNQQWSSGCTGCVCVCVRKRVCAWVGWLVGLAIRMPVRILASRVTQLGFPTHRLLLTLASGQFRPWEAVLLIQVLQALPALWEIWIEFLAASHCRHLEREPPSGSVCLSQKKSTCIICFGNIYSDFLVLRCSPLKIYLIYLKGREGKWDERENILSSGSIPDVQNSQGWHKLKPQDRTSDPWGGICVAEAGCEQPSQMRTLPDPLEFFFFLQDIRLMSFLLPSVWSPCYPSWCHHWMMEKCSVFMNGFINAEGMLRKTSLGNPCYWKAVQCPMSVACKEIPTIKTRV